MLNAKTLAQTVLGVPIEALSDREFLICLIRTAGLTVWPEETVLPYGICETPYTKIADRENRNTQYFSIRHNPVQLAETLLYISKFRVCGFLEVSAGVGIRTALLASYLKRFNTYLANGVWLDHYGNICPQQWPITNMLPFLETYKNDKNDLMSGYDLTFIDTDDYNDLSRNYKSVGERANICVINNINDEATNKDRNNRGGPGKFWKELKEKEASEAYFEEFLYHPDKLDIMGIGVRVKRPIVS